MCFFISAIENDKDIRALEDEITELQHSNSAEEESVAQLRREVDDLDQRLRTEDSELRELESSSIEVNASLENLRATILRRLRAVSLPDFDPASSENLDIYVEKLMNLFDEARSVGIAMSPTHIAVFSAVQEALAGIELM